VVAQIAAASTGQAVAHRSRGETPAVRPPEVAQLERGDLHVDTLGLQLAEATTLVAHSSWAAPNTQGLVWSMKVVGKPRSIGAADSSRAAASAGRLMSSEPRLSRS